VITLLIMSIGENAPRLGQTSLVLFLIIGSIWGFVITWLFYDKDKPLGVIILNSKEDEVCTYVEKNRFFIKPKLRKKSQKKKRKEVA